MNPIRRISAKKYRGMGDVVAALAQPVARGLDRVFGTHLEHCPGCRERQESLNRMLPFLPPAGSQGSDASGAHSP